MSRNSGLIDINKAYYGLPFTSKEFKMPKIGSYELYTGEDHTKEGDNSQSKNE